LHPLTTIIVLVSGQILGDFFPPPLAGARPAADGSLRFFSFFFFLR
jgi:hypothetical protein